MYELLPMFIREPNPAIYLGGNYLVLDFECTNNEHGSALAKNTLLLACWRLGQLHPLRGIAGQDHYHWGNEYEQGLLSEHISQADFIVCHNTKFELGWLRRCGLDLRGLLCACTMIGEKILAGNRKMGLSLDATAERRGLGKKAPTAANLIKAGVCPSQIPAQMLADYCAQDVALTDAIWLEQRKDLEALSLLPVFYCRNIVTPALADIEFNGMTLDASRVSETYAEYAEKYASLEKEFSRITGGINPKSPKQLSEFIYDTLGFAELTDHRGNAVKTPAGGRLTDKHTLAKLEAETDEQKAFLKVAKELVKLKTPLQNLTKMQAIAKENPSDPRVFASYNQTVTQTDRLSSTGRNGGFQFHNFDRAFKRLFRARAPGGLVCEADAPQLEFRVAAFLGHDEVAKRDIQEGVDVHANTATTIGCSRQNAKPFTFKPLYGGNSGSPGERRYYKFFRERYSGIYRTQSGWTMGVARDKHLVTPWGLRFYWPDTKLTESGYVTNTTQIFNYPIQSFATADIIPLCLVLLWHRIGDLGDNCTLVNTIHDSVIAEINPISLEEYTRHLVNCFTVEIYELIEKLYGMNIDIPLGVGIKSGKFWGEGPETKHEALGFCDKHEVSNGY